jgi:hypothetical protein
MKCEKLDWQINMFGGNTVTVAVKCIDFDQSLRFVELLKTFIFAERDHEKAPRSPEAAAGKHEATEQREVQSSPQESCGADRQHHEQTDTGSVT